MVRGCSTSTNQSIINNQLIVGNRRAAGKIQINSNNSKSISVKVPEGLPTDYTFKLPNEIGSVDEVLKIDSVVGSEAICSWGSGGGSGIVNNRIDGDLTIGEDINEILTISSKLNIPRGETGEVLKKQTDGTVEFEQDSSSTNTSSIIEINNTLDTHTKGFGQAVANKMLQVNPLGDALIWGYPGGVTFYNTQSDMQDAVNEEGIYLAITGGAFFVKLIITPNVAAWYKVGAVNENPTWVSWNQVDSTYNTTIIENWNMSGSKTWILGTDAEYYKVTATDPEGMAVTFTYTVKNSNNTTVVASPADTYTMSMATIVTNGDTFIVTPQQQSASNSGGSFTVTIHASDGLNSVSVTSTFSQSFAVNAWVLGESSNSTAITYSNNAYQESVNNIADIWVSRQYDEDFSSTDWMSGLATSNINVYATPWGNYSARNPSYFFGDRGDPYGGTEGWGNCVMGHSGTDGTSNNYNSPYSSDLDQVGIYIKFPGIGYKITKYKFWSSRNRNTDTWAAKSWYIAGRNSGDTSWTTFPVINNCNYNQWDTVGSSHNEHRGGDNNINNTQNFTLWKFVVTQVHTGTQTPRIAQLQLYAS